MHIGKMTEKKFASYYSFRVFFTLVSSRLKIWSEKTLVSSKRESQIHLLLLQVRGQFMLENLLTVLPTIFSELSVRLNWFCCDNGCFLRVQGWHNGNAIFWV